MPTAVMKCRVCGKEYEACRSANRTAGVFRWQEVACSPECGAVYLEMIQKSRSKEPEHTFGRPKKSYERIAEKNARIQTAKEDHSEHAYEKAHGQEAARETEEASTVSKEPVEAE